MAEESTETPAEGNEEISSQEEREIRLKESELLLKVNDMRDTGLLYDTRQGSAKEQASNLEIMLCGQDITIIKRSGSFGKSMDQDEYYYPNREKAEDQNRAYYYAGEYYDQQGSGASDPDQTVSVQINQNGDVMIKKGSDAEQISKQMNKRFQKRSSVS